MAYMNAAINNSSTITDVAGATITAPAMKAVKYSTGKLVLAGAGDNAIGIVLPDAAGVVEDDNVTVLIKDIGLWTAGAAVAKGAELASDADGKAVTAVAGDFIVGIALQSASAAGDIIQVQVLKAGYKPSPVSLNDLTDVDLTTPPTDGQILKYVAADTVFKAAADS